jgi:hypothetical protein
MRMTVALGLVTILAVPLAAQDGRGEAKAAFAGKKVEIEYGRPTLRGRDMLGLAKVGDQWRMGSNDPTRLSTEADLAFGALTIPAGKYILKATRTSAEAWTMNVTKGAAETVVDIPLTTAALPESVEAFTIKLTPDEKDKSRGVLELQWGKTALRAPFTVK